MVNDLGRLALLASRCSWLVFGQRQQLEHASRRSCETSRSGANPGGAGGAGGETSSTTAVIALDTFSRQVQPQSIMPILSFGLFKGSGSGILASVRSRSQASTITCSLRGMPYVRGARATSLVAGRRHQGAPGAAPSINHLSSRPGGSLFLRRANQDDMRPQQHLACRILWYST